MEERKLVFFYSSTGAYTPNLYLPVHPLGPSFKAYFPLFIHKGLYSHASWEVLYCQPIFPYIPPHNIYSYIPPPELAHIFPSCCSRLRGHLLHVVADRGAELVQSWAGLSCTVAEYFVMFAVHCTYSTQYTMYSIQLAVPQYSALYSTVPPTATCPPQSCTGLGERGGMHIPTLPPSLLLCTSHPHTVLYWLWVSPHSVEIRGILPTDSIFPNSSSSRRRMGCFVIRVVETATVQCGEEKISHPI